MENTVIAKITDADFGLVEKENTQKPGKRTSSRGIIVKDGKIAIIYKEKKNEYKLPGGGLDKAEKPKDAFERECLEEVGVEVCDIRPLGQTIEYKSQENFQQVSYVYIANVLFEQENSLTQKEKDEGTTYIWLTMEEALEKMKGCLNNLKASDSDDIYRSKFMVLRDIRIVEYVKEKELVN